MSAQSENIKNTLTFIPGGLFLKHPRSDLLTFEIFRGYVLEEAMSSNQAFYWLAFGVLGIAGVCINNRLNYEKGK